MTATLAASAGRGRLAHWLERPGAKTCVLALTAYLSLPTSFVPPPTVLLDSAWRHSLQAATTGDNVFGKDFLFTYGPLGWLFIRAPVNKVGLLFCDLFVLASLLSIYRRLLPSPLNLPGVLLTVALAAATEPALAGGPEGILFILMGYWLWRLYTDEAFWMPLAAAELGATILFFGKANYGLIVLGLIPAYGVGLLLCARSWKKAVALGAAFVAAILIGNLVWRIDLKGYLRASSELARGYGEAMSLVRSPWVFLAPASVVAGIIALGLGSFRKAAWRDWLMMAPFVMLATALFYKNAFVRADEAHFQLFLYSLPLLLSVWTLARPGFSPLRGALIFLVVCGVCQLAFFGHSRKWIPLAAPRYLYGFAKAPWRQNGRQLAKVLRTVAPQMILPTEALSTIGSATVDVMPLDSDLALINGLKTHQQPVLQSYADFTPWLDDQSARFLTGGHGPEFLIYVARETNTIDGRVAAWDDSISKRALLENFVPVSQFRLHDVWTFDAPPADALVVLLRHSPDAFHFEPLATQGVAIALGQPWAVPQSTNYEFLWLDAPRTLRGRLLAAAVQPPQLLADFDYSDGASAEHRVVLPILQTGVLINHRVESAQETQRWLHGQAAANATVRSICFRAKWPGTFQPILSGRIVTCRLVPNHTSL